MADRDEIIYKHLWDNPDKEAIRDALDEYMKATCLELLEYMGRKGIICYHDGEGYPLFKYKGIELTKEQLFENFL